MFMTSLCVKQLYVVKPAASGNTILRNEISSGEKQRRKCFILSNLQILIFTPDSLLTTFLTTALKLHLLEN